MMVDASWGQIDVTTRWVQMIDKEQTQCGETPRFSVRLLALSRLHTCVSMLATACIVIASIAVLAFWCFAGCGR
jgi:hypothetical protein